MKKHHPQILTDGGPWADHDYACPVCWRSGGGAMLDIGTAVFHPCGKCQANGWTLHQRTRLARFLWPIRE